MEFKQCQKCGLTLPVYLLHPAFVMKGGKKIPVTICSRCKEVLESQFKKGNQNETKTD